MYTHILMGIDINHEVDYDREIAVATHLAESANARLTALAVLDAVPAYIAGQIPEEALEEAGEAAMARLRKIVGPKSEIATEIRHGSAADALLDHAREHGVDCIVVASHKPGLKDYFLGSTAARVVRHAPCSVHVIR